MSPANYPDDTPEAWALPLYDGRRPWGLTASQVEALLRPIKPRRIHHSQGQSHVPAYDIDAHLTRIFGWGGWSKEILDLSIVHEVSHGVDLGATDKGKPKPNQGRWWVTYSCTMRLTIKDQWGHVLGVYEDAATGSAQNMPSPAEAYDFAIKNAVSYALKRCAKDLGDQFGLSLYNKGNLGPLVGRTLVVPEGWDDGSDAADLEEHIAPPETLGNDERDEAAVVAEDASLQADAERQAPAAPAAAASDDPRPPVPGSGLRRAINDAIGEARGREFWNREGTALGNGPFDAGHADSIIASAEAWAALPEPA